MEATSNRSTGSDQQLAGRGTDDGSADETSAIQAGIRETRERLGDTVEQIGDRIDPSKLKAQAINEIHDATIGRVEDMAHQAVEQITNARRTVVRTVRENPLPLAMVGIGMGWLAWSSMSKKKSASSDGYADDRNGETAHGLGYNGGTMSYGEDGTSMGAKVGEIVDSVKHTATELTHRTQVVAEELGGMARDQARTQSRRMQSQYQSNPLVMGAAALALGLMAGLALPATEKEIEIVGDKRDQLMDKAKEVASDAKGKVEEVAGKVFDQAQTTVKDAAYQSGLMA
jgi:ElaB/YqjD/DUF883 family membrane-anchored ribosome-binding protein